MIRVGKKSELYSDVYINFCYRNMQVELCDRQELCWQIPWMYFMADIRVGNKVLCVGNEKKCIRKIIHNQFCDSKTIVLDDDQIDLLKENEKFDIIIGTGIENIIIYQRFLGDGGKFVITDEIGSGDKGIDLSFLREVFCETSLKLYRKSAGFNPVDFQFLFNCGSENLLVFNDKIYFGIVFFKEFCISNLLDIKFTINQKRICSYKPNIILDYLEIDQDKAFKQIKDNSFFRYFILPKKLNENSYFTINTLQEIYNTDSRSALELMNELICLEYIVRYNNKD